LTRNHPTSRTVRTADLFDTLSKRAPNPANTPTFGLHTESAPYYCHPVRKRALIVSASAIAVAIIAALFWPGPKEPEYEGKKLSEWLLYADDLRLRFPDEDFEDASGPHTKEAAKAIRAIGTNAAPVLLNWFNYRPNALRMNICWLARKLPAKVRQNKTFGRLVIGEGLLRAGLVYNGFFILGPASAGAVPELVNIMENDRDGGKRRGATQILMRIGDVGMLPLLRAMTNQANPNRFLILSLNARFYHYRSGPTSAIPSLVQCLADEDPQVVMAAADHLGNVALDQPDVVVPALTNALAGTNTSQQVQVMRAISKFGSRGSAAVPVLLPMYDSTNSVVSRQAGVTLRFVDPEALSVHQMGVRHE